MLAPHHAVNTELCERRLASERLDDALVFVSREAMHLQQLRSRSAGRSGSFKRLGNHLGVLIFSHGSSSELLALAAIRSPELPNHRMSFRLSSNLVLLCPFLEICDISAKRVLRSYK